MHFLLLKKVPFPLTQAWPVQLKSQEKQLVLGDWKGVGLNLRA